MNNTSLTALAAVTALAVAGAGVALVNRQRAEAPPQPGGPLVPGLLAHVNDVARIDITAAKGTVSLGRGAAGWEVLQKDGYRADADQAKSLVVGLAEANIIEPRTALPDLYARLGVEDPKAGTDSTLVTLKGAGDTPLASVILGKTASSGGAGNSATLYVRRAGEAQSWMVRAPLTTPVETEPMRWLDHAMPRLPRDRVRSVEIRQPDGATVGLSRAAPADKDFTITGLPEGARTSPSAIDQTTGALASLTFEDVAKADPAWFAQPVVATYHAFDGTTLTVKTARHDQQAWLTLDVTGDTAEAKDWKARFGGWAYRVYDALADDLTRKPEGFAAKDAPAPAAATVGRQ